jgi:hypothetical protein
MRKFLPLITLALSFVSKGMASSGQNLPLPFAPPSEAFCKSNILGDDAYLSFFKPCTFTFYKTSEASNPDHFSCDTYDTAEVIASESRKVMMWPESCVAAGPRCYSMVDYPDLSNYTIFDSTDYYSMTFPSDSSIVSVDCTADFTQAQIFMENLPEELEDVASSIAFGAGVLLFAVLAAIVACICCCCLSCKSRKNSQMHYTPLPSIQLAQGRFVPASQFPHAPTKVIV